MRRREFLQHTGFAGLTGILASAVPARAADNSDAPLRPNILWISCEDIGPDLGCYGQDCAVTPRLDRFATQAVRYTRAFSSSPVCAPSRSAIITGMYPTSLGSHHMRSAARLPEYVRCFPEFLRNAGYYCTNHTKQDYNFPTPPTAWDDTTDRAHWRNRAPGQPFFSVINLTMTHESQIRSSSRTWQDRMGNLPDSARHDPARVPVPPYHPDTPEVRQDWARYHDNVAVLDFEAGRILDQLEADGLAGNTIVFFFSDHGAGMPRHKRWHYDSGLHIPLLVRFPERWQHLAPAPPGATVDRLVSFPDFGPTVLRLAGIEPPPHMQGRPFLPSDAAPPRDYVVGVRDRMDERYDCARALRDTRYKYIRNFYPQLPWAQYLQYMYQMPTMQVWQRLHDAGKLEGAPASFMEPHKPIEELYDTVTDPHELENLAAEPAHAERLAAMRNALYTWMRETRDLALMPEAEMHARAGGDAFLALARDSTRYPLERLLEIADLPRRGMEACKSLIALLEDPEPLVRYWAVNGLMAVTVDDQEVRLTLNNALADNCESVRMAAADALHFLGEHAPGLPVLLAALESDNEWARLHAVNVLDRFGASAETALHQLKSILADSNQYVVRVAKHAVAVLEGRDPTRDPE